jgi:hypothetical protein
VNITRKSAPDPFDQLVSPVVVCPLPDRSIRTRPGFPLQVDPLPFESFDAATVAVHELNGSHVVPPSVE